MRHARSRSTSTRRETWRGGQNQVLLTVTGLEELGHPAVLVAHEGGELRRRAREGLRFVGFAPKSEFDVHAGWQLDKIIADVKPDVVHAHDPMGVALAAMALQMPVAAEAAPLVVASRRVDFHLKRHAFSRWKYRQIDVFIAASRVIAGMLAADGIPADRIDDRARRRQRRRRSTSSPSSMRTRRSGCRTARRVVGNVAALVAAQGPEASGRGRRAVRPRGARRARSSSSARASCASRSSGRSRTSASSVTCSWPDFATTRSA